MNATRVLAHVALLAGPVAATGRWAQLARPQAVACVVLAVALGEIEAASRTQPDPSRARAPGTGLALVSAGGLLGTTWAAIGSIGSPAVVWWSWLGAPLVVVGIVLRALAIRALGASFTSEIVATPGRPLVTNGIYGRLRHPSDAGLLLVAVGLAVLGASVPALLVVLLVVAPSVAARIVAEERALREGHRAAHAVYRRRVGLTPSRW